MDHNIHQPTKFAVTEAMVTAAHEAMMRELFALCQPNRGDVFSFMDDQRDVVRAAVEAAIAKATEQTQADC